MANYVLSYRARNDLSKIFDYTYNNFGEKQADFYLTELHKRFSQLAHTPLHGKKLDDYLSYIYKSHTIIYRAEITNIKIIRVLHNNSDTNKHLK